MIEQTLLLKLASPRVNDTTTSRLRQEYQAYQSLFHSQPVHVQQYLGAQAGILSEAVLQNLPQARFTLPEAVACPPGMEACVEMKSLPVVNREQSVGGLLARLAHGSLLDMLSLHLAELEASTDQAISLSAGLLRYAVAHHMIYNLLPAGKSVIYASVEGDDIPNKPVEKDIGQGTALKSNGDTSLSAILFDKGDGVLPAPYVEAASHFYLPQWVAFDGQGCLLPSSIREAETYIASMQHYLAILQAAVALAPYMIADDRWQQKRYGMLGQLVNQGRALANFKSHEMIKKIQHRVAEHKLDRGLHLSLPYFDDQQLVIKNYEFTVIPCGWIMFIPAFVVLAARAQQIKVADDAHLSFATRKHLINELHDLELAFTR